MAHTHRVSAKEIDSTGNQPTTNSAEKPSLKRLASGIAIVFMGLCATGCIHQGIHRNYFPTQNLHVDVPPLGNLVLWLESTGETTIPDKTGGIDGVGIPSSLRAATGQEVERWDDRRSTFDPRTSTGGGYAVAAAGSRGIRADITIPALPVARRDPHDSAADISLPALHCSSDRPCSYEMRDHDGNPIDLNDSHYQIFAVVRRNSDRMANYFIASRGNGSCSVSSLPDPGGHGSRDAVSCTDGGSLLHLGWSTNETTALGQRIDRNLATLPVNAYRFSSGARPLSLVAATSDSALQLAVLEQGFNSFYTSEIPPRGSTDFRAPADSNPLLIGGVFVTNTTTGQNSALTWFDGDIVAVLVYRIQPRKGSPPDNFDPANALQVQDYLRNHYGPQ